MKKYKTAVFIGRFQPLHNAHLKIIKKGLDLAEQLIIVIGSSNKPSTVLNPWNTQVRENQIKRAIRKEYNEEETTGWSDKPVPSIIDRVRFTTCRDYLYNDYKWSTEVYSKALSVGATTDRNTALLGCMKDDSSYYLKMFPMWEFEKSPYMDKLDSTKVRKLIFENKVKIALKDVPEGIQLDITGWCKSPEFTRLQEEFNHYKEYKLQWESAPYVPTFNTVDAVVIKSGCILLIKRKFHPGKGLLALPGGFLNPKETIKKAMLRELKEETRIVMPIPEMEKSIATMEVFDHPQRSLRGRTITYAFLLNLGIGSLPDVKASSDASGAFWMPMADMHKAEETFFEDHYDIITKLTSKY